MKSYKMKNTDLKFGMTGAAVFCLLFVMTLLVASSAWATTVLTFPQVVERDGPIYWARLAEGSGTTLLDSSGSGVDGSYTGSTAPGGTGFIVESGDKKAGTFPGGAGDTAEADDDPVFDISTTLSVLVLAKNDLTDLAASQALASRFVADDPPAYREWTFFIDAAEKINVAATSDGTPATFGMLTSTTTVDPSAWHFYAFTYSSGTLKVFVDGVELATSGVPLPSSIFNAPQSTLIGGSGGFNWDGLIDEVLIYDKVLTPSEVADHYDALFNPEPATMAIFGVGLVGLLFKRKFRFMGDRS